MVTRAILVAVVTTVVVVTTAKADVYRWDTGQVIPGTVGIVLGPGVELSRLDLSYGDFSGCDLSGAAFDIANLSNALFEEANLTDASLDHTILTDANLSDAIIRGASFRRSGKNLTFDQLASTASYKLKDLRGITINIDMRNWDLSGQDLSDADFFGAFLGRADLTDAIVNGVHFPWRSAGDAEINDTHFFSADQLYSTASYQEKDLRRVQFVNSDLTGWDFSGQDLRCAELAGSNLRNANLSDVDLRSAGFVDLGLNSSNGLDQAFFDEHTIYNEWTFFPPSFEPMATGLTFRSSMGDFDLNNVLDAVDIDILAEMFDWEDRERSWREISQCSSARSIEQFYLLDGKGGSEGDLRFWVEELRNTYFGDANLDGEFNSSDLVQVFEAGEYEDALANNSGWADGDWNADREFTSSDLVVAFQDGGYEQGPNPLVNGVPEPTSILMLFTGLVGIAIRRRLVAH